jgi:hypothetical protein
LRFLLEPPLRAAPGAATERVAGDDPHVTRIARAVTLAAFIGVSGALYANVEWVARRWPLLGARSGREFMLTSGLAEVDESAIDARQHVAALSLFILYPLWFDLGRAAAR